MSMQYDSVSGRMLVVTGTAGENPDTTAYATESLLDASANLPDTQAQADDGTDRSQLRAAYRTLRDNAAALRNDAATMPATLTAAQVRGRLIQIEGMLADATEALAALLRYLGRRGV